MSFEGRGALSDEGGASVATGSFLSALSVKGLMEGSCFFFLRSDFVFDEELVWDSLGLSIAEKIPPRTSTLPLEGSGMKIFFGGFSFTAFEGFVDVESLMDMAFPPLLLPSFLLLPFLETSDFEDGFETSAPEDCPDFEDGGGSVLLTGVLLLDLDFRSRLRDRDRILEADEEGA